MPFKHTSHVQLWGKFTQCPLVRTVEQIIHIYDTCMDGSDQVLQIIELESPRIS